VTRPVRRLTAFPAASRSCGWIAVVLLVAAFWAAPTAQSVSPSLGQPEAVAPGVELYRMSDPTLLSPPGAVAVQLLRVDPGRVRFQVALAQDTVLGTETVADIGRRAGALAAVNAGFFLPNGEPAGLMKVDGELVSDVVEQRGAVAFLPGCLGRADRLLFDQVSARVQLDVGRRKQVAQLPVDAVDTLRGLSTLVLFTPSFWIATTTPCDGGTEWVIDGRHLEIVDQRPGLCTSMIPRHGAVLSAGPGVAADRVAPLEVGRRVKIKPTYQTVHGSSASEWEKAPDVVGGVGLLLVRGQLVTDWRPEKPRAGFDTERHPRTMIGVARDGRVWLVTVDGRNPALSLGMNFAELQHLAHRLDLVDALNLDGGGSTTMVVRNRVLNHPSDAAGPRKVSDAILVMPRGRKSPGGPGW
jgi:hypothetical protein